MNELWQAILHNLAQHLTEASVGSGVLLIAIISHWPEQIPRTMQDWWTWARNSFQGALPIRAQISNPIQAREGKENQ